MRKFLSLSIIFSIFINVISPTVSYAHQTIQRPSACFLTAPLFTYDALSAAQLFRRNSFQPAVSQAEDRAAAAAGAGVTWRIEWIFDWMHQTAALFFFGRLLRERKINHIDPVTLEEQISISKQANDEALTWTYGHFQIVEEAIFRGVLLYLPFTLNLLLTHPLGPAGILIEWFLFNTFQSLIFAAAHPEDGLSYFIPRFAAGFALGLLTPVGFIHGIHLHRVNTYVHFRRTETLQPFFELTPEERDLYNSLGRIWDTLIFSTSWNIFARDPSPVTGRIFLRDLTMAVQNAQPKPQPILIAVLRKYVDAYLSQRSADVPDYVVERDVNMAGVVTDVLTQEPHHDPKRDLFIVRSADALLAKAEEVAGVVRQPSDWETWKIYGKSYSASEFSLMQRLFLALPAAGVALIVGVIKLITDRVLWFVHSLINPLVSIPSRIALKASA